MYGDADIPGGAPVPTWAGAKHFDKIFLLGTPNEGSVQALQTLLDGLLVLGLPHRLTTCVLASTIARTARGAFRLRVRTIRTTLTT